LNLGNECDGDSHFLCDHTVAGSAQDWQSIDRLRYCSPTPCAVISEIQLASSSPTEATSNIQSNITQKQNTRAKSRSWPVREPQNRIVLDAFLDSNKDKGIKQRLRVAKGAFLLSAYPQNEEFRYLTVTNGRQLRYQPGDGFSPEEATPNFIFYVTGRKKHRRRYPLPGLGELSLGTPNEHKSIIPATMKRKKATETLDPHRVHLLRAAAKDIWPTPHDFMDGNLPTRLRRLPRSHTGIPEVERSNKRQLPHFRPASEHAIRHKRGFLEFQGHNSSIEPGAFNMAIPSIFEMRPQRVSSPFIETDIETSVSGDEDMLESAITCKTAHSMPAPEESDSASEVSDESVHSYVDEHGNIHVFRMAALVQSIEEQHSSEANVEI
jgi:hypothetical protein